MSTPKLKRLKRTDFYETSDYDHALQVRALVSALLERGMPHPEVVELLHTYSGGFTSWLFLWEHTNHTVSKMLNPTPKKES
jgi:hypothetical protein